jgi:hypothetical protein
VNEGATRGRVSTHRLGEIALRNGLCLHDDRVAEIDDDLAILEDVASAPVISTHTLGCLADERDALAKVAAASLGPGREQGEPTARVKGSMASSGAYKKRER